MTMAANPPYRYAGNELAIFEKAVNWKRYWSSRLKPYVRGDVLEVGAGIGANTHALIRFPHDTYTSLEPDAALVAQIEIAGPRHCKITGTLQDLTQQFDTILYIDVLEHIEDDRAEMAAAAARLKPDGHLIVLSPAHQSLYTPFDQAIGHFRRYSKESLAGVAAGAPLRLVKLNYLDSVGLLASAANRLLLAQAMPTERQILTWDRLMVPVSRVLDPLTGYAAGKSVLGVWKREG